MGDSELKTVVLEAVKAVAAFGLKTPKAVSEFRALVETASKLEDSGEIEKLKARVMDLENRFNLSRIPQAAADARKTPRIM